jgi:nucleotide-binding universal stress UspA family protein
LSHKRKLSKILVAVDGSNESIEAAYFAISLAARGEAQLVLLYVFYSQIAYAYSSYFSKVEDSSSMDAILSSAEKEAKQWFAVIESNLANTAESNPNIKLETEVIITPTSVSDAIIDYAKRNMVDLIVVGAKGKSALKKILAGSTTSELLKYSRFPILVVKTAYHKYSDLKDSQFLS